MSTNLETTSVYISEIHTRFRYSKKIENAHEIAKSAPK